MRIKLITASASALHAGHRFQQTPWPKSEDQDVQGDIPHP